MLQGLSSELKEILLKIKKERGKVVLLPVVDLFEFFSQNDKVSRFLIESINFKSNLNKKTSLERLVIAGYSIAKELQSDFVYPFHIILSYLKLNYLKNYQSIIKNFNEFGLIDSAYQQILNVDGPIVDITNILKGTKTPKIIGRDREIDELFTLFLEDSKRYPLLIGQEGLGKTAIAYGLAQRILNWECPSPFIGSHVFTIDTASFTLSSANSKGLFEKNMEEIFQDALNRLSRVILFFDDIQLLGPNAVFGLVAISKREGPFTIKKGGFVNVMGVSTYDFSSKAFDIPVSNYWKPLELSELKLTVVEKILRNTLSEEVNYSNIELTEKAIKHLVLKSQNYNVDLANPGRVLHLLNKVKAQVLNKALNTTKKDLEKRKIEHEAIIELDKAIISGDFNSALKLNTLTKEYSNNLNTYISAKKHKLLKINEASIDLFFNKKSAFKNIDQNTQDKKETQNIVYKKQLLLIESYLNSKIIGQEKASKALALALRRFYANIDIAKKRPIGSFLFLGPTGVGKTETAKVLAFTLKDIFKLKKPNFLRLDMSDFMEKHTSSRLVGSPPGYVGYDEGGQLTEFVMENPSSIILFDEIEKAHPDVLNLLLQIMEEGELSDGAGVITDFSKCLIILTSNIGTEFLAQKEVGFSKKTGLVAYSDLEKNLIVSAKKILKPELINRLDEVIVFRQLEKKDLLKIVDLELFRISNRLLEMRIKLTVSKEKKEAILAKGDFKTYGARELRRVIQKDILDKINTLLIEGNFKKGTISLDTGLTVTRV